MLSIAEIKRGLFSYEEVTGGFVASFKSAGDLLKAAEKTRQANVKSFDCFSPCPIHGMDKAMGLNRSWIPVLTFIGGIMAVILGLSYIIYIDVFNWPIVFGGKPFFSWPAYVPILFELAIYFASVFTVVGVLVLGRLGFMNRKPPAKGVTSDVFAIWLGDKNLTRADVERILSGLNPQIEEVQV
ncbi:MAG TPA: DUF3341 domain-containing protein [Turneriella sp.]|nr:DUF3341 domain-containing protein [Turneriella sp.]HMY11606.1 DUF3341 domain-containing protein [Turneriella sp.]HNA80316.1 DUF3341 domain-containing protein [Turneriella sp.]HNE20764.1 DUF3341 domain-containing protein [Turneriella sp.]HNL10049.1 DUF3341 domain-containing protein [Turneriella sp.]